MDRIGCVSLVVWLTITGSVEADLRAHVQKPDTSFRFELVDKRPVGQCRAYVVKLTSQTWRGMEWWHWLSILVPEQIEHRDKAILFITGGSNRSRQPNTDSGEAHLLALLATQSQAVLAVLQQVPNQPLFDGLTEDRLIAYTFDKFLNGGDSDWPLLLPMVKSAVRAMDTVQQVTHDKLGMQVTEFIVSGASKRGWTTWLTAAADQRVIAIAPMVIDVLNMQQQMRQQRRTYNAYSEQIQPYTELRVQERMETDVGRKLTKLVDPYQYRDILTLPKLVVLGTNDPYWTVNAASLYFPQLKGDKHLFYLPNASHGLGAGIVPTVSEFFRTSLAGKTLPKLTWQRLGNGTFRVQWQTAGGRATLWQARSANRDFRKSQWTSRPLAGERQCEVGLEPPVSGWLAYFVEVHFPGASGVPFTLSSEIQVLPSKFPYPLSGKLDSKANREGTLTD